jgi:hypothetical protein
MRVDQVRRPDDDGGEVLPRPALREEDEVVQAHAVAHRDQHHAFDLGVAVDVSSRLIVL